MFHIGICDDEPLVLRELQKIIVDICHEFNYQCEVHIFDTGESILSRIEELNLVFLDIGMPQLDGIELGKMIRNRNPKCKIVIATGMIERFKEAFQIKAMRFVTKPFDRKELEETLAAALEASNEKRCIELYYQRNKYVVPQEEIQYIQAYSGYSEFLIRKKMFRKKKSLNDLEKMLDNRIFVRVNRQYIVNLRWVKSFKENCVCIADKKFIVSRRKLKEFERKYIEYDLKYKRFI